MKKKKCATAIVYIFIFFFFFKNIEIEKIEKKINLYNKQMLKSEEAAVGKLIKNQRVRCFFDIDFNGHSVGRIIFELFN